MAGRFVLISVISGLLFGIMDGWIHANPLARKLYAVYAPIARKSIHIPAGLLIDLLYGFVMAGSINLPIMSQFSAR